MLVLPDPPRMGRTIAATSPSARKVTLPQTCDYPKCDGLGAVRFGLLRYCRPHHTDVMVNRAKLADAWGESTAGQ